MCATSHDRSGNDIFFNYFLQEAFRSNDSNISCINFLLRCNPKNASKVVKVTVCIDDCMYWSFTQYIICKGEACCSRGTRCKWVNDKPPVRGFYKSDIRYVIASGLPDSFSNFEEAMNGVELSLSP